MFTNKQMNERTIYYVGDKVLYHGGSHDIEYVVVNVKSSMFKTATMYITLSNGTECLHDVHEEHITLLETDNILQESGLEYVNILEERL